MNNNGKYKQISPKEIADMAESDPMKALAMIGANAVSAQAEKQASGQKIRKPRYHDSGWAITLHEGKKESAVGLWSVWLGNKFCLSYPREIEVSDELIMNNLNVEKAKKVRYVSALAVNDWNYEGEYKDPDKPLEKNGCGQIIAYRNEGFKCWTKFYGSLKETGERVWIDKRDEDWNGCYMPIILNEELTKLDGRMSGIFTYPYSEVNQYAPEAPTTNPNSIQKYMENFINLLAEISLISNNSSKLAIDYGFGDLVMVPEDLEREGYQNIIWLEKKTYLNESVVKGEKEGEIIMLKSGRSISPWVTIRQLDIPETSRNKEGLVKIIKDSLTF